MRPIAIGSAITRIAARRPAGMRPTGMRRAGMRRAAVRGRVSLVAIAFSALVAAACTTSAPPPAPSPEGPCRLTIATGVDVSGGVRDRILREWNASHPRACFQTISAIADEEHSEMIGAAQSGSSRYDVFNLDIQWIPEFAESGYLLPLDESLHEDPADFPEKIWSAGAWDGTQYAAPLNTDVALLYYREDLVGRGTPLGPAPGVWQRVTATAAPAGAAPPTRFAGQFAPYEGLTVNALEAIWAAGGEVVDADGRVVIEPRGRDGVENLIRAVRGSPPAIPKHVLGHHESESIAEFRDGRAVFMRNWAYVHEVLSGEAIGDRLGAVALPWPSVLGGQYLAVSAATARPELAQELVAALTGPEESALLYNCGGFVPARTSGFAEVRDGCGTASPGAVSPGASPETTSVIASREDLRLALATARPRPRTPHYTAFSQVLRNGLHALLSCHASAGPDGAGCPTAAEFTAAIAPKLETALSGRVVTADPGG